MNEPTFPEAADLPEFESRTDDALPLDAGSSELVEPIAEPEAVLEPDPEPEAVAEPESVAEPEPDPEPEAVAEPEAVGEPGPDPEDVAEPDLGPQAVAEPTERDEPAQSAAGIPEGAANTRSAAPEAETGVATARETEANPVERAASPEASPARESDSQVVADEPEPQAPALGEANPPDDLAQRLRPPARGRRAEPSPEDPFEQAARPPVASLLFQAPQPVVPAAKPPPAQDTTPVEEVPKPASKAASEAASPEETEESPSTAQRRRRRGGKGRRTKPSASDSAAPAEEETDEREQPGGAGEAEPGDEDVSEPSPRRRTRRRRRSGSSSTEDSSPGVVTKVREPRLDDDGVVGLRGSTRLEAKKQRRREGREAGRRRTVLTEAEYLARRESVERVMLVRRTEERTQIAVLEDGVLVEHYVSRDTNTSMAGNIYVGRVQNVLPSMEAAFVDIGKGRNAVLYAGEVNWDAAGLESGKAKRIENALEPGQAVLVQVTKDPIGHKGARLTSQVSLPGRYLVYVPDSGMTGISRKLPDTERARLKKILRDVVPETAGVIVRTAAEGATEAELRADVERLTATWEQIRSQVETLGRKAKGGAPAFLHGEPDLTVRVVRDIFNEDFASLVVSDDAAWDEVSTYVGSVAPDLADRLSKWTAETDLFAAHRVDEQIAKAMDRKVWLPSGGSLVIDRTEAMTVIDVNTGKFVGSGGNLEETVTRNNIEAAEELVRQLRLRDIGGIIVIDFIDMVLESNRDLVVRRLLECLGRDRTKHQVAEVTSLGLVQMTRKRVGSGLLEVFSEPCEHCNGRGYVVSSEPVAVDRGEGRSSSSGRRGRLAAAPPPPPPGGPTPAQIAAAAHAAAVKSVEDTPSAPVDLEPAGSLGEEPVAAVEAEATAPQVLPAEEPGAAVEAEATAPQVLPAEEPGAAVDGDGAPPEFPDTEVSLAPSASLDGAAADAPAPPRRRRHGRVVAPAGPPRASQ